MNRTFNILKYEKLSSTNDKAKDLLRRNNLPEFSVITAYEQTKGRGQRDNVWHSNISENLIFSIISYPVFLTPAEQFYISKAVSEGIVNYLNSKKRGFKIKWPNDIYYENKKICGILIENSIKGNEIKNSIIGIGLNVNEEKFPEYLPYAVSLKNITGINYNIESELYKVLNCVYDSFKRLRLHFFTEIDSLYSKNLYKINESGYFKDAQGIFEGTIKGTTPEGKLILQTSSGEIRTCNFKEVEFLQS